MKEGWTGSTDKAKGTPVFAIDHPGPGPKGTCIPSYPGEIRNTPQPDIYPWHK